MATRTPIPWRQFRDKSSEPGDFKKATFGGGATPASRLPAVDDLFVIDLKGEYIPMPKTRAFRALHSRADQPLLLPNIWDVGGAKLAELLGAKAVATTSAGVSWSLGYPDGNKLPIERQAQLANDLVKAVTVPVSIDMESGYSDDPVLVSENLKRVLDAGIAGINIEDGTGEPSLLAKKIEAIKRTASAMKVDVFVNAQTDVYLQNLVPDENKAEETLARATVYSDAGADGLFVPRLNELTQIAQITVGTRLPVNLLAWPGLPKMADLAKLGVRRLSAGPGISQIVWQQIAKVTEVFLATGDSEMFAQDSMTRGELQRLFANREVNSIVPVRLPLGHMPGLCGDRRNRTTLETEVIVKEKCKELIQCQKT